MRNILAAIARVLNSMRLTITTWIRDGGRWVAKLIPGPTAAPTPEPLPSAPPDDGSQIRHAAGVLAQGRDLQAKDLIGLHDRHVAWLRVLDRRQLCVLMTKSDDAIRAHVLGRTRIAGVPNADPATVAAMANTRKSKAKGYRTLRDKLAEMEADGGEEPAAAWAPAA